MWGCASFDVPCYLTFSGFFAHRVLRYFRNWILIEVKVGSKKVSLFKN